MSTHIVCSPLHCRTRWVDPIVWSCTVWKYAPPSYEHVYHTNRSRGITDYSVPTMINHVWIEWRAHATLCLFLLPFPFPCVALKNRRVLERKPTFWCICVIYVQLLPLRQQTQCSYIPIKLMLSILWLDGSCMPFKKETSWKGMHGKDSTGIDRADPMFGYPLEISRDQDNR